VWIAVFLFSDLERISVNSDMRFFVFRRIMPYKVQKTDDQWCVYKENADGSAGKQIACHDNESKAKEQSRALYAAEESKSLGVELDEYIFSEILEEEKLTKAADGVDEVYKKFSSLVNMSASELEKWAESPCSREASLTRAPIKRVLNLLKKKKDEWDANDVKQANRVISFISRMSGVEDSDNVSEDCPYSKKQISLRNWGRKSIDMSNMIKMDDDYEEMEETILESDGEKSYEQMIEEVAEAWRGDNCEYTYGTGYVSSVYPSYVIVRNNKKHWKVSYSRSDGKIKFAPNNKWVEVRMKSEWVEKNFDNLFSIKSISEDRIGAYGIIWGDKDKKDLHDEFFTAETKDITSAFDALGALPWLFHHAADSKIKSTVVGVIDKMEADDVGLWYEARIREHELYKQYVKPLVEKGKLFSSSGAYPGSKERDKKTGEIKRWTIAEISGTHIPAEYRMLDMPVSEVKSMYVEAGIDENIIKSFISESEEASLDETAGQETAKVNKDAEIQAQVAARNRIIEMKLRLSKLGEK